MSDKDAKDAKDATTGAADASGVELSEGKSGGGTAAGADGADADTHLEHCKLLCIPCPCKHSVKNQHDEYTPYHERRCTNLICLVCYLFFLVAWGVIFGLAWQYGKPDVYVWPARLLASVFVFCRSRSHMLYSAPTSPPPPPPL